jgi:hypothetical protein
MTDPVTKTSRREAVRAKAWPSPGLLTTSDTSEVDGAVAVAAPDNHGNGETEHRGQGSPGEGEQHRDQASALSLTSLLTDPVHDVQVVS